MATKDAAGARKTAKAPAAKPAKKAARKPAASTPRNADAPDLVYVVRPGDDNEELRYSLRSVAKNAPHRDVWIVGTVPTWVRNVKGLPLDPVDDKFENQRQSLAAAAAQAGLSDPFVLFNDDMFVMEPITRWDTWNLDTIEEHWGGPIGNVDREDNEWLHAVWCTYKWMGTQGHPNPLYYENHTPLLYDKVKLAGVLEQYPADRPFVVNGTYPITGAGGEGEWGANAKLSVEGALTVFAALSMGMPYLSTEDTGFAEGTIGEFIRNHFLEPGPYEEAS